MPDCPHCGRPKEQMAHHPSCCCSPDDKREGRVPWLPPSKSEPDPLEVLRLAHSQWSSRYLDQIDADDYPGLLETMAAAITAWEKERAHSFKILPGGFVGVACPKCGATHTRVRDDNNPRDVCDRAEVLKVAEEMGDTRHCGHVRKGLTTDFQFYEVLFIHELAARLRKACE